MNEQLEALATEVNSVAIHLVRRVRMSDAALGVPPAQLSALSVLVFGGPRTVAELAAAEQVTGPTMSGVVRGLEQRGLIRRTSHPTDGRASVVRATPAGVRIMKRGRRLRVQALVDQLGQFSPDEIASLERGLRLLRRLEQSLR